MKVLANDLRQTVCIPRYTLLVQSVNNLSIPYPGAHTSNAGAASQSIPQLYPQSFPQLLWKTHQVIYFGSKVISTRRLRARPAAVLLASSGWVSARPLTSSRLS